MQLTTEQIIAACAEDVHGWRLAPVVINNYLGGGKREFYDWVDTNGKKVATHSSGNAMVRCYNPLAPGNDHQATALLEAWRDSDSPHNVVISLNKNGEYVVVLHVCGRHVGGAIHPHLPTAIVLAVVSAEKGETVTIKEND